MKKLVSVIIPTYRRISTLRNALLSLCQQDYSPLEIIVVDDNADQTWNHNISLIIEEIRALLPGDKSLHLVVNRQNMGAAQSRNAGICTSTGSYITFLDDDDFYLPAKISTQLRAMLTADADYSLMDLKLFNEHNQLVEHKRHPYASGIKDTKALIQLHLKHHLTGTDALMFRREYLFKIGCFGSIDIGDEFYLMMKAIENGGRFLYIPEALVHALVHYDGSGLSAGPDKIQGENDLFRYKQTYFHLLSKKDVRYIRMRHHAVLAFAHIKAGKWTPTILHALYGCLISPFGCLLMLSQRH